MFSLLSTALFMGRNGYRAQNGEDGRFLVAGAQGVKFLRETAKYNNAIGASASSFLGSVSNIAKSDKAFNALSKTVKFASDNVNPLIACLSAFNVITAQDKQTALISESGNIGGMLLAEGWMAKNLDKYLSQLPISKKWMPVVRGIAFVMGSITASTLGQKMTSRLAKVIKASNEKHILEEQKALQSAVNEKSGLKDKNFNPKRIEYRA